MFIHNERSKFLRFSQFCSGLMSSDLFVVLQYDRMPLPMPQIKLPAETTVERISQSLSQLLSKLNQWVKSLLKWNQLNSVHPLVAVINVELAKTKKMWLDRMLRVYSWCWLFSVEWLTNQAYLWSLKISKTKFGYISRL